MPSEIKLYEAIGGYGMSAKSFVAQIPANETEITVRINSPGGDVADGLAMYHYLKDHPARVTTIVDGYAASAASLVMLAGDVRRVHKASIVMVHNPWSIAMGDADDMRHTADVLDEHGKAILDIYRDATGMDESDLLDMMEAETWMRGVAAQEYGFATDVVNDEQDQGQAAASAAWCAMLAAIKEGDEVMSRTHTRKELETEREELRARIAALESELSAQAASVTGATEEAVVQIKAELAEKDETISALSDAATAKDTQIEALTNQRDAITAEVESLKAAAVEMQAKVDGALAERDEKVKEVASLKVQLANPAQVDARMAEAEKLAQAKIDAEADRELEEARARAEAEKQSDAPSYAKWQAIADPREKRAYYLAHKQEILSTMDEQIEEQE